MPELIKTAPVDIILYESDWERFPTAIADTRTKNKEALETAKLLRYMGIKNYRWPLALVNPALQGLDPHDIPTLSQNEMKMVAIEAAINPWFFLREVAVEPGGGLGRQPHVRLNRSNLGVWWSYFNHITFILVQPRQTGKSFAVDLLMAYLMTIFCTDKKLSLVTKDDRLRVETSDRVKALMDSLPDYLKLRTSRDRSSSEIIEVSARGNTYTTYVAQKSEAGAEKLGRGAGTDTIHFDEPPFQDNLSIHYGVIIGSTSAKIDMAKKKGAPWGNIMTTTAGKRGTPSGKYFYAIIEGAYPFNEHLYDSTDIDDLYYTIYKGSREGINGSLKKGETGTVSTYACFNHRQLGFPDRWMHETISRNKNPIAEDVNRDMFNIWSSGGESNPIEKAILDRIVESRREFVSSEIHPKYRYTLRWFFDGDMVDKEINRRDIIIGMDCSEGIGKDFTTLIFMDLRTGCVVGTSVIKESNTTLLAAWIHELLVRFPRATLIIENKSMGIAVIDALRVSLPAVGINPYRRLYNRIVDDCKETPQAQAAWEQVSRMGPGVEQSFSAHKKAFGYGTAATGRHSRDRLYENTLSKAAPKVADGVRDEILIEQLMGLVMKDGRIDHQEGKHDDCVIGWLLCLWFIFSAKNIRHYGIDPKALFSELYTTEDMEGDYYNPDDTEEQEALQLEMNEVLDLLEVNNDHLTQINLENRVRSIESRIRESTHTAITASEWMERAREAKRRRIQKSATNTSVFDDQDNPYNEGVFSSMDKDFYNPYK